MWFFTPGLVFRLLLGRESTGSLLKVRRTQPEQIWSAMPQIVLQKSKVAGLKIFRENTKQRVIADSYDLNRVTEVACEFCVRP
ncbi:hypothetical protein ACVWZW_004029 [Bradyrhizobium sp. F1.13.4]